MLFIIEKEIEGLDHPVTNPKKIIGSLTLEAAEKSKSASEIIQFLSEASETTGILVTDKNTANVDSMHLPACHCAKFPQLEEFTGGVVIFNHTSLMTIHGQQLPKLVSLIHEMGHAVQNINNKAEYEDHYNKYWEFENLAKECKDTKKRSEYKEEAKKHKYAIENDNIQKHEKPVCVELDIKPREEYS